MSFGTVICPNHLGSLGRWLDETKINKVAAVVTRPMKMDL
jgi:hypothetical protein